MYIEVVLAVKDTVESEQLIAELIELGYEGFEERGSAVAAYIDKTLFDKGAVETLSQNHKSELAINEIADQNWNQVWESHYHPVQVGDFAGIRARFHQPLQHVKHELIITPKMSFGTGHHATTYMMMDWMREINFTGKSVLDMGTGTGVLAILAEKLGAEKITAIDSDEWSIKNAKENFENNGCTKISLLKADNLITSELYDVVLANINLNVLLALMREFQNHLVASGLLIVSGILKGDESVLKDAATSAGIDFIAIKDKNNWLSMTLKKKEMVQDPRQ